MDLKLKKGTQSDLAEIYGNYIQDFPESERKSFEQLTDLLAGGCYELILIHDCKRNEDVAYAMVYKNDSSRLLWVDYIAVKSDFRSLGYGSIVFRRLVEGYRGLIDGILLEVEPPSAEDPDEFKDQVRRVRFYERLSAYRLDVAYWIPTLKGPYILDLFYMPVDEPKPQKTAVKAIVRGVYETIHSDIPQREQILSRIIDSITDCSEMG